jgi:hypothetical protein
MGRFGSVGVGDTGTLGTRRWSSRACMSLFKWASCLGINREDYC